MGELKREVFMLALGAQTGGQLHVSQPRAEDRVGGTACAGWPGPLVGRRPYSMHSMTCICRVSMSGA